MSLRSISAVSLRAFLLAVGVAIAAGCFSERSTTAPTLGGDCSIPLTPELLGATIVIIQNFTFQPSEVRVKQGGKVVWANCSAAGDPAHTSTADGGEWSSPLLDPGTTFGHTFAQAGTFTYHCEPHPFMTASVVVEP
jgi:plastocyanin